MPFGSARFQTVSLEGEVVEIVEDFDQRSAKVVITAPVVVDVTGDGTEDVRLGDRVVIHGWFGIEKEAL